MDQESKEALFRAFKAHDTRFDGKVYIGVTTTGIYCRPVCAARMPKFGNCEFFGSATEAEQAGFKGYVTKPVQPEQLYQVLAQALLQAQTLSQAQ